MKIAMYIIDNISPNTAGETIHPLRLLCEACTQLQYIRKMPHVTSNKQTLGQVMCRHPTCYTSSFVQTLGKLEAKGDMSPPAKSLQKQSSSNVASYSSGRPQRNPTINEEILISDTTYWETMGIV